MKLEIPVARHTSGSKPTHSSTYKLGTHFVGLDQVLITQLLESVGLIKNGKPTKKSLQEGYVDTCGKFALWNLKEIEKLLKQAGLSPERKPANQELPENGGFSSLQAIGTYFDVSGVVVGRWLRELGLRDEKGVPLKRLLREGKVEKVSYVDKKQQQKREFYKWELLWTLKTLQDAGHIFEFDFEKSLKGKGENSDVVITTVEDRAKNIARDFAQLYNNPKTRKKSFPLVEKLPKFMQEEVEKALRKPGWITSGQYRKV